MRKFLTGRQRVVFNFVRQHIEKGVIPYQTQIAAHFRFSAGNTCEILKAIARKGYLTWESKKPRTFKLLPPYKDDTRCALICDKDAPELNIQKGDFLHIDTGTPAAAGEVILSSLGEIKRFSAGDTAFGKVIGFSREMDSHVEQK